MKNEKCILFVRCSTVQQDIEQQINDLKNYVKTFGYSDKQMVIIGEVGASAYKVNQLYKQKIKELYNTIESQDIKTVFVWHLNRIARNEVVAMEIKEFLISHNVQLIVKEPSIKLLNDDGTVNSGAELCFSLFSTMSKQQALELKSKTSRAKRMLLEQQRYAGGVILYGYKVGEDGKFELDEEKAGHIKYMFESYVNRNMTLSTICKELKEMGVKENINRSTIRQWMNTENYYNNTKYPPIISKELFEQCKKQRKENLTSEPRETKRINFLNRLIKCECGHTYTANVYQYFCATCKRGATLSIKYLDSLCWCIARDLEEAYLYNNDTTKEELKEKKLVLQKKIATAEKQVKKSDKYYNKIKEAYLNSIISLNEYKEKRAQEELKNKEYIDNINQWNIEINTIDNLIKCQKKDYLKILDINTKLNHNNLSQMRDIVRKWITEVRFDKINQVITITTLNGTLQCQYHPHRRTEGKLQDMDGVSLPIPMLIKEGNTVRYQAPQYFENGKEYEELALQEFLNFSSAKKYLQNLKK